MRQAATMAGLATHEDEIFLALEPEAASVYTTVNESSIM